MLHISCNIGTRNLPDMYALGPVALGLWAYISGKSLVPMLQLLHMTYVIIMISDSVINMDYSPIYQIDQLQLQHI